MVGGIAGAGTVASEGVQGGWGEAETAGAVVGVAVVYRLVYGGASLGGRRYAREVATAADDQGERE